MTPHQIPPQNPPRVDYDTDDRPSYVIVYILASAVACVAFVASWII